MAEIRKYDPAKGNAIVEALRAAMGEPVRPVTPGERPVPRPAQPDLPATTTSWVTLKVTEPEPADDDDD